MATDCKNNLHKVIWEGGGGTERGNQFADTFGTGNHAQSYEKLSTHKL